MHHSLTHSQFTVLSAAVCLQLAVCAGCVLCGADRGPSQVQQQPQRSNLRISIFFGSLRSTSSYYCRLPAGRSVLIALCIGRLMSVKLNIYDQAITLSISESFKPITLSAVACRIESRRGVHRTELNQFYNRRKGSFNYQRDIFCQNDLKCSQNTTDYCCN